MLSRGRSCSRKHRANYKTGFCVWRSCRAYTRPLQLLLSTLTMPLGLPKWYILLKCSMAKHMSDPTVIVQQRPDIISDVLIVWSGLHRCSAPQLHNPMQHCDTSHWEFQPLCHAESMTCDVHLGCTGASGIPGLVQHTLPCRQAWNSLQRCEMKLKTRGRIDFTTTKPQHHLCTVCNFSALQLCKGFGDCAGGGGLSDMR